jgi:hypothetical protein
MPAEIMSAIAFLTGALVAMVATCKSASKGAEEQREILKRGHIAQGRVLRVWRPPVAGSFTRVYFEFQPHDAEVLVQGCHIDRRSVAEPSASLPAIGASVSVRYIPENPTQAVIAKLVSRFTD